MSEREVKEQKLMGLLGWRGATGVRRSRGCPDETALAAYVDGTLADRERRRLESHAVDCGHCLGQIGFLARTETLEVPDEAPGRLLARARRPGRLGARVGPALRWQWQTALAVLAVATLAGLLWLSWPELRNAGEPALRSEPDHLVAPELLSPREGDSIPRIGAEFRWQAVPEARYYRVRLVTASGDVVWEEQTEGTDVRLPADLGLVAGERYFAWVRAYTDSGRAFRSTAVGFRVAHDP